MPATPRPATPGPAEFVIPPPPRATLAVAGGGRFPVRRIFCVGRNYAAHAREMGGDPVREPPFFFTKPGDAVVADARDTPYPTATADLHHEMELVVAIALPGASVTPAQALALVYGYAPGLDLTRRDLQEEAKAARRPWDMSKGFDASAPVGEIVPAAVCGHLRSGSITLRVNGETRQRGDLADQIWTVPEVIAALSTLIRLQPGDLIFTGTPEGVGPVSRGDLLSGEIAGLGAVATRII